MSPWSDDLNSFNSILHSIVGEDGHTQWLNGKHNCLVFDLETTGIDRSVSKIINIGFLLYRDGVAINNKSDIFIKTPYDPITWGAVYAGRDPLSISFMTECRKAGCDIEEIKRLVDQNDGSIMNVEQVPKHIKEAKGKTGRLLYNRAVDVHCITSAHTLQHGSDRVAILSWFRDLIMQMDKCNYPIVGHNIMNLDVPFVENEVRAHVDPDFVFPTRICVDTGMIVKADQLGSAIKSGESNVDFYRRVDARRSRVKWALDTYCFEAYKLGELGVDPSQQHKSAAYDCWVNMCLVHRLLNA